MKYQLSVLCPGIRVANWQRLYDSVAESFSGSWEIIFCGPYPLPESLANKENVFYIQDWGTPMRCQQRTLLASQGKTITWAADDGYFLPRALDIAYESLEFNNFNLNFLVMGKYREGDGNTDPMMEDKYYILSNHDASSTKWIEPGKYMLNVGLVPRETLLAHGGWDCQFEVCPMAYNDLAIRLQSGHKSGRVNFIIQNELMFKCSHMPGHEGDHGPIHDGQVDHDQPLFKKIWGTRDCEKRKVIDINNWVNSPERWERRFGK